jgi:hypothetical protein
VTRTIERALLAATIACAACGGKKPPEEPVGASVTSSSTARVDFVFDSLDDRPASSEATRGKPTVIVFTDTGSLLGQAQLEFVVAMSKNDADKTNYLVAFVEPRSNRAFVEVYKDKLGVTFPVAFADDATLTGTGPFGELHRFPTTVILDRVGRIALRVEGRVAKADELRAAMRDL